MLKSQGKNKANNRDNKKQETWKMDRETNLCHVVSQDLKSIARRH